MKAAERDNVYLNKNTKKRVKEYCEKKGFKLEAFVTIVLDEWLEKNKDK